MANYPTNDEYLTQTNETVFDVAQSAVNLAVGVLKHPISMTHDPLVDQAFNLVLKYADWRNIDLPKYIKRELMIKNYGEEEAQAIWVKEWPANQWFMVKDIAGKYDRDLYKYLCDLEFSSRGDGAVLMSAMTGARFMWELKEKVEP